MSRAPIYLLVTCDTKGREAAWVKARLGALGVPCRLVDTGSLGPPEGPVDVPREEVFRAAGPGFEEILERGDRGYAVDRAAEGATRLVLEAHGRGDLGGVLALGGSAGTTIGTAAMRALPLGVPKVMVSTLASGPVRQYVGAKDILMLNAVVDIAGLNRISRGVLGQAAAAMAGLVEHPLPATDGGGDRPLVAASMFGVTTPCVEAARARLEEAGYEVLVFHATGNGGEALESLATEGVLSGVLDLTTTELADELVGGVLSAGPERLRAAGAAGVPQVLSVGATDMVNFLGRDTVPAAFEGRRFHVHNANVTLMRTTVEENATLGEWIGRRAAAALGPTTILLPGRGVSALDAEGQAFDDPAARAALFGAIRKHRGSVECLELDHHLNDRAFAEAAANKLLDLMERKGQATP